MASVFNIAKTAFARERLAVSTSVVTLTSSVYRPVGSADNKQARGALVTVLGNPVYYTIDGTAPTNDATVAGVGIPVAAAGQIVLETFDQISKFKVIRNGASDALIEVVYFR